MDEKVQLVRDHRREFGLNACCEAIGLSKGTWDYRQKHYQGEDMAEELKPLVTDIIDDHPGYGYRRIQVELLREYGRRVNHKRLRRLLRKWQLALHREVSQPPSSGVQTILDRGAGQLNLVKEWHDKKALEMLSTDFTEVRWANGTRKAWLMAMVDPVGRGVMGWSVGLSANRALAQQCWRRTRRRFDRWNVPLEGIVIHHDLDAVYTSHAWLHELLVETNCIVSYSERGAKDNPWIESVWARFKDDNKSKILTAKTQEELKEVIDEGFRYYNNDRRHSALDYRTPIEYYQREGIAPDGLCTF